jgi:hypothetical protein
VKSDHSPCSTEVKNGEGTPVLCCISAWCGAALVEHKDNFTFIVNERSFSLCECCVMFSTNRDGDVYAAMRDCHTALQLDPDHMKAHFR